MKNFYLAICIAFLINTNYALGSEAGMPQLNPKFWASQVFWLLLIFCTLYLIIWKIFLPKITYSIESRKSKIVNNINDAQKLKDRAEKKLSKYNTIIEESKIEAKKIIKDSRKKLDKEIDNKKKKFSEEIEKELLLAEKEIQDLRKSSAININSIAEVTSSEVIKQIINVDVNKSNVSAVVDEIAKKQLGKYI